MKKAMITILVCVNVGLLVMLILGVNLPILQEAKATYPGSVMPHNTLLITGQIRIHEDVLYMIDMGTERLTAFEFQGSGTKKRLRALGTRDLKVDLK
ncbi:MAG: hypothetical protein GY794_11930 [bacterium]|nr:hypothetical protein [bacterium]